MSDVDLLFGVFLTPSAAQRSRVLKLAALADQSGLDLIGIQDHPYQPAFLDTWTLLSAIAAKTTRIRLFPDVANLPLRPPAVLARSVASLSLLTGGRVELGLGSGACPDRVAAMGGPARDPATAVDALAEAIEVIRALWRPGPPAHYPGRHYRLAGAEPGPLPATPIGIWIGAYRPRMLALTGRLGDGWLPSSGYAPPEEIGAMTRTLDAAAAAADRDPAGIRRIYNISGQFTATPGGFLTGPPRLWSEQLAELVAEHRMSGFVLAPGPDPESDLRRFAEEVVPLVREAFGGRPGPPPPAVTGTGPTELDEESRPRTGGPSADGDRPSTGGGQHLIEVHDQFREELRQLRQAVEQVAGQPAEVAELRSLVNELTRRQNHWTVGAFCATYCRNLTLHHTLEDDVLFDELRRSVPGLGPVLDRLVAEHLVIARQLRGLDDALVALIGDPGQMDRVRAQVERLQRTLLSHFTYEEAELVRPLDRLPLVT
jgi:alkanesulfonate monooxygenase SsuD/methylene tetrahydromethanopterin reductase-like flavin-dependent oxidoreductase (luciferase family)/hemerythrin-like domain-containing protein